MIGLDSSLSTIDEIMELSACTFGRKQLLLDLRISTFGLVVKIHYSQDVRSIINEARTAEFGYNHLISNKREWNNCFIKNHPKILETEIEYK